MADTMQIEILADGTIKTTTDPISAANHQSAEQFLKQVTAFAGGPTSRQRRGKLAHVHAHDHAHQGHE